MTIKAIETVYNGFRFRSRLEARWAVFFDTLGIPYEYEKEGYDLDGIRYLPDFWLPEQDCFIEVKPGGQPEATELMKCSLLAAHTSKRVFMFSGSPWPEEQRKEQSARAFFTKETYDPALSEPYYPPGEMRDPRYIMQNYAWGWCPFCGKYNIWRRGSITHDNYYDVMIMDGCQNGSVILHQDNTKNGGILDAYTAARQARFEYGEGSIRASKVDASHREGVVVQLSEDDLHGIAMDAAMDIDREYFKNHPDETSYTREPIKDEFSDHELFFNVKNNSILAGIDKKEWEYIPLEVEVTQIKPGVRQRKIKRGFVAFLSTHAAEKAHENELKIQSPPVPANKAKSSTQTNKAKKKQEKRKRRR